MRTRPIPVRLNGMTAALRRVAAIVLGLFFAGSLLPATASAHQPVNLDSSDRSPARGPLLLDGTVSFAVYAPMAVQKAKRGFRFRMSAGQPLRMQVLITDTAPANRLKRRELPVITLISPSGKRTKMKPRERTPFYEPYSGTSYLYLSRYSATAESGTYRVWVKSRTNTAVRAVVAVGYREVPGQVRD